MFARVALAALLLAGSGAVTAKPTVAPRPDLSRACAGKVGSPGTELEFAL